MEEAQDFSKKLDQILKEFQYLKSPERGSSGAKYSVQSIIGDSPGMRDVREQIYIAGATAASCLIEGETGTGKELVAHAIHNVSMRKIFPFVKVNCSAIPENLMESEFFGYEEGSFTGGVKGGKAGKFEKAHLGSMFLDEINAMSLKMQPKLLRALQEKEIERVGGTESIPVNVRVLSASNMPLDYLVEQGVFRRDLFYRLNIITVKIPPLRRRKEDILPLTQSFIKRYNSELCRNVSGISDGALQYLTEYDWPGNVRELQNVIERVMASTWEDRLDMAVSLAELGIDSIPINALMPIPGTPLEHLPRISREDILRTIAIFRYINPEANIRLAAGRALLTNDGETAFKSGASATITGNMLTTVACATIRSDRKMLSDMGRNVTPEYWKEVEES